MTHTDRTETLAALVRDFLDPDPCQLDHHGYCQAHSWLCEGRCPHARAREALAEVDAVSAAVAPPTDDTETAEPREPDNPAAWALAQHIADHPVSTVQAAFRYLNAPLTLELREEPAAVTEPTDPTHGLSVQHADALWDAVAIPGPHTPTYPEQHERVCRAVRDIIDELTPARDEPADQTALRDRIADKLTADAYECDGKCGLSERECYDTHPITFSAMAGGTTHVDGSVTAIADSLLAVLPEAADWDALAREADQLRRDGAALHARAEEIDNQLAALRQQVTEPADRAAVLADVERAIRAATGSCGYKAEDGCDFCGGVDAALDQVRRMADETATETPAAEPTAEDIARAHVTSLHLIGEQLATIESWFWEHLADVRDAGARQDETATETPAAVLTESERKMLAYALDQAQEHIWSRDGFTDEDQAAVDSLRRLTTDGPAAGARQDGTET